MAASNEVPTFSREKAEQLAALLAERDEVDRYNREQQRIARRGDLAGLVGVLNETVVNDLIGALNDARPKLEGAERIMADNLIVTLDYGGRGLARMLSDLKDEAPAVLEGRPT